jgi:hypothetical protein
MARADNAYDSRARLTNGARGIAGKWESMQGEAMTSSVAESKRPRQPIAWGGSERKWRALSLDLGRTPYTYQEHRPPEGRRRLRADRVRCLTTCEWGRIVFSAGEHGHGNAD